MAHSCFSKYPIFISYDNRWQVGLKDVIPHNNAGILKLPATSLPIAALTTPNFINTASPPDDPPEILEWS